MLTGHWDQHPKPAICDVNRKVKSKYSLKLKKVPEAKKVPRLLFFFQLIFLG